MPKSHTTAKTVSKEANLSRRRRYTSFPTGALCLSLTPVRLDILRFLAELRFLSLPQIARLCCPSPRQDLAEKNARRQMRLLFDAGLVNVIPVSRAALAPLDTPNDASLLYGSAPNIYAPTVLGLETLHCAGLIEKPDASRKKATYGPKNSLFLAHELAVRDMRVWLEACARLSQEEQWVLFWRDGQNAVLKIRAAHDVRPDAWFVYRMGQRADSDTVLVGLVEVDRGTERGDTRWQEKLEAYKALFSGEALRAATGYVNARVLVIAPNGKRRDQLTKFITKNGGAMAARFWLADQEVYDRPELARPAWRQGGGSQVLSPLWAHTME